MILVTGAAGKTGQAVAKNLIAEGQQVRGLVRRSEQKDFLTRLGVQEIVIGDMRSPSTINEAAAGVRAIYHICPNVHPEEFSIGEIVIRAAQAAEVKRFIYHSVLHPQIEAMSHHWQKLRVEEKLLESGLSFTILQPAAYMQNVMGSWDRILREGIYAVPYALDTRLSMVDLQDVAAAVTVVLSEEGHEGAIYELCGPDAYSQIEIAGILGEQLGRDVRAEVTTIQTWEKHARSANMNEYAVDTLVQMFRHYEQTDFWGNPRVLSWLIGRSPTTFAGFVQRMIHHSGG